MTVMARPTRLLPSASRPGWPKTSITKRQIPTATKTMLPTVPSTAVFTHGLPRWTVWARGVRTARAAAITRLVRRRTLCAAYAPRAGTCLCKQNGLLFSLQSAEFLRWVRCLSLQTAGMIIWEKAATARMPMRSRRCLLAIVGTTVGITAERATKRCSGVLQRAIATTRTACI